MKFVKSAVIAIFVLAVGIFGTAKVLAYTERDPSPPEITSDREILEIPCSYTQEQLVEGLTAHDDTDGDLTSQILTGSFSRFIEKGLCNVTYVVFDSANQPASLTRQVRFTDYYSPRFTLTTPLIFSEGEGSYDEVMSRIGATDLLDGDRKDWVTQTDTDVNYQRAGTYHITVSVDNSYGDLSEVSLPVHVTSGSLNNGLRIELSTSLAYLRVGEEFQPAQWISGVYDGQGNMVDPGIVTADAQVDVQTPGTYEISYQAADEAGNTAQTWLTVIVQE